MVVSTSAVSRSPGDSRLPQDTIQAVHTDLLVIDHALWLVPVVIAGLGAWRPRWAVYGFAAGLPLFGSAPGGPNLLPAQVSVLVVVLIAVLRGRSPGCRWKWSGVVAAVWVLVSLIALTPWPRPPADEASDLLKLALRLPLLHGHEPLFGWSVLLVLVLGLLLGWSVLRLVPRSRLPQLALATSVGVVATVTIGVALRFGWLDLWQLRPVPRAMDEVRMQSLWVDSRRLAEYLILAWPLTLVWSPLAERWGKCGQLLQGLVVAATLVGVVWSLQRGAWITMAAQLLALALLDRTLIRRWWRSLAVAVAVVVALLLTTPGLREPLLERALSSSDSSRIHYALVATDMFRVRPLLGWGPGSWAWVYDLRAGDRGGRIRGADTAHGLPTQIAAERGAIGLAAFSLLLITLAVRCRPPTSGPRPPQHLGVSASAVGFLVYGGFQYISYLPVLEWLLWMIAAMWVIATDASRGEARLAAWGGATVTVAALIALPWQHEPAWRQPQRIGLFGWEQTGGRGRVAGWAPTHRWTSDYVAVRLPRTGRWLSFSLVDGHPRGKESSSSLKVFVDGQLLLERAVPDNWHRCRVRLPESGLIFADGFESEDLSRWTRDNGRAPVNVDPPETVLVEFEVEPGFRPFRSVVQLGDPARRPRDVRRLGLVLGNSCDAAFCWDDPVARRRAQRAGLEDTSGCFADKPPRRRIGPTPEW